jgi:Zn-dependent membrane protease YugP
MLLYLLFMAPGIILALIATVLTRTTFDKYSRIGASSGLTGAEAAQRLLESQGVTDVTIEQVGGFLSDHYDPRTKTLRLSPAVYGAQSLSAIGVACHEAGHALQHARGYAWLGMRSALVPATQFGSYGSYIFLMLGMFLHQPGLLMVGVLLFTVVVAFSIVTLPVEWDASARAKHLMVWSRIVSPQEQAGAAKVLNAAFLTYVASAVSALLTLLHYLSMAGLIGGRRSD